MKKRLEERQKFNRFKDFASKKCPKGESPTYLFELEEWSRNKLSDSPGSLVGCVAHSQKTNLNEEKEQECQSSTLILIPSKGKESGKTIPLLRKKRGTGGGTHGYDLVVSFEKNALTFRTQGSGMSTSQIAAESFTFRNDNGWRLHTIEEYRRNTGCPDYSRTYYCGKDPWMLGDFSNDCSEKGVLEGRSLGIPEVNETIEAGWKVANYEPFPEERISLKGGGPLFFRKGSSKDLKGFSGWIAGRGSTLFISWEAPLIKKSEKKWLASDHIELWLLPNQDQEPIQPVQWILPLENNPPLLALGKGDAPQVERLTLPPVDGKMRIRMRIHLPSSAGSSNGLVGITGTLSLSFGNGTKQVALDATSELKFNNIFTMGILSPSGDFPFRSKCKAELPELE